MPIDVAARVLENTNLGGGYFLTTFSAPQIAPGARPGQFVMVGSLEPSEILLRRPFSICLRRGSEGARVAGAVRHDGARGAHDAPGRGAGAPTQAPDAVSLLYRSTGRGTRFLAHLPPGEQIAMLGPLGVGFSAPRPGETPIIVAGGIGIAAFPFLVEEFTAAGTPPALIYGARTSSDLPMLDWFRERLDNVVVTTDDGSAGERALVTVPLERALAARAAGTKAAGTTATRLYVCGPTVMMRAVAAIAAGAGVACEAALETPMACGYGVCVGCVVEVARPEGEYGRYRRVCVDGPVFDAAEIRW